jgi:hypothetical protein
MKGFQTTRRFLPVVLAALAALLGLAAAPAAWASHHRYSRNTISIAGTPVTHGTAGSSYSFTPAVVSSAAYSFSISNKPAWAGFSIATGTLSGTPAATNVGTYSNITIKASNGGTSASLAPFALTVAAVAAATPASVAPAISGTPATSVLAGSSYAFTPAATDANGYALTFTIAGLPAWASFDAVTGRLSGSPTSAQIGSYAGIVIGVSDGKAITYLRSFTITVNAVVLGSAALSWTPPTQNVNGSALTDLAGYNVYYGTSSAALTTKVALSNSGLTAYTLGNLASGTYYFAVTAYNSAGAESAQSNVGSKSVP